MNLTDKSGSNIVLNIWKVLFSIFFLVYPLQFFDNFSFQNGILAFDGKLISDSFGIFIEGILNPIVALIGFISVISLWVFKKPVSIKLVKIVIGIFLFHLVLSSLYYSFLFQSQAILFIIRAFVFIIIFSFMFTFFNSSNKVKQFYNYSSLSS